MAVTPGREETLAPKPSTVSSTSSLDTSGSLHNELADQVFSQQASVATPQPLPAHPTSTVTTTSTPSYGVPSVQYTSSSAVTTSNTTSHMPSSISLVPRSSTLHIPSPAGVVVPPSVPSTNTVPEFLYQLTKMLTDHNRDVIEWSNGKIEVHNPHKLQTHVLNRYFRHSKFASFQRQLNYFGFRKLAGKGKMAPCSYVNDATTNELGSLLLIKRKTGNEPKSKAGKKRELEDNRSGLVLGGANVSGSNETVVNPVLAGILQRSTNDNPSYPSTTRTSVHSGSMTQPPQSQQALARVAVGKGIRHSFSLPKVATTSINPPRTVVPSPTPNPLSQSSPVQASLSALQSNFKNSLQDFNHAPDPVQQEQNRVASVPLPMISSSYIPGSLSRDDSLVDLAMIPLVDGLAETNPSATSGLTFVDFPWQDPGLPPPGANQS